MLLARPKVFGEINDPNLNVWSNGDDGGYTPPPKYQCQPAQLHRVRNNRLQYVKPSL